MEKAVILSSATVPQHHSAPEDLLPPLTCPLPDEPPPQGPSVAPASTPASAPGQHPGGFRLRGLLLLLHTAPPFPSLWPTCTWDSKGLSPKNASSLDQWLLCWDHTIDDQYAPLYTYRRCKHCILIVTLYMWRWYTLLLESDYQFSSYILFGHKADILKHTIPTWNHLSSHKFGRPQKHKTSFI